jgi:serine/threonine protein phosphatase PrpC
MVLLLYLLLIAGAGSMFKTNDNRMDLKITEVLRSEVTHIKEDWLVFLVCFFISRHSIINEIYPFAIVALCSYCHQNGPSFAMLLVVISATLTVRLDFVYILMFAAVYIFFYNFRHDGKKPILLVSSYAACVLMFSKTTMLILNGFSMSGMMLNIFESVFIFSSIILINEGAAVVKKNSCRRKRTEQKAKETAKPAAEAEAATSISTDGTDMSCGNEKALDKRTKVLSVFSDEADNKIRQQLLWQNINVKFLEVLPETHDSFLLSVTVRSERPVEEAKEAVILIVRNTCGVKLKCIESITASPGYHVLKFRNLKRVRIRTYVSSATKEGSDVSGDSCAYAGRGDKYYAVLCDGIGSGEEAYNESNGTVDMLSKFLYTDFTEEQIIRTLNSLLMLKLGDERYVTLDLSIIDYGCKEIRMYKAGAAPTYILSGGTVERIVGKSLPIGILDDFECNVYRRVIRKGDIIIMISDGIIDSVNMDEKKSLDKYFELIMNKDPQTIANSILSYALRGQDRIIDDMTVLVTKIG